MDRELKFPLVRCRNCQDIVKLEKDLGRWVPMESSTKKGEKVRHRCLQKPVITDARFGSKHRRR